MSEDVKKAIDALERKDAVSFKQVMEQILLNKINSSVDTEKNSVAENILHETDPGEVKKPADPDADEDRLADPQMAKMFRLSSEDIGGHEVVMKSLGTGPNKPIVMFIDGKQWELFADKELAMKETRKYIQKLNKEGIQHGAEVKTTPKKEEETNA